MSGAIIAGVGTAITAGTQLAGAVMGGEAGPDNWGREMQARMEDYNRKVAEWTKFWDDRIPRMSANQKKLFKDTKKLLNRFKGRFAEGFKEQNMEKVHREFVGEVQNLSKTLYTDLRGDIDKLQKGELDPNFRQRVTEAEQEINRISQDSLNQYVQTNAREKAKGGMGFINPERQDEMVAGNFARSRDEARGKARKQVEDTLASIINLKGEAGGRHVNEQAGLLDDYSMLGQQERARLMGGLQSAFGFKSAGLRNRDAQRQFLDNLMMQKYLSKPQFQFPAGGPDQQMGTSDAQRVVDVGGATGDLLGNFNDWWQMYQQQRKPPGFQGNGPLLSYGNDY